MAEPPPNHSQQCEKVLALDRAVRCLERAREELAQCIWSESEARIELWIAQIRKLRPVFRERLIAYQDHTTGTAPPASRKSTASPDSDADTQFGEP